MPISSTTSRRCCCLTEWGEHMAPETKRFLIALCIAVICWANAFPLHESLIFAAIPATAVSIGLFAVMLFRRANAPYSVFAAAQIVQAAGLAIIIFFLMKSDDVDLAFAGGLLLMLVLPFYAVILAATPIVYAIRHRKEADHNEEAV